MFSAEQARLAAAVAVLAALLLLPAPLLPPHWVAERVRSLLGVGWKAAYLSAIQERLRRGFSVDDLFPEISDLPENLTVEQFRERYGGVGSDRYRDQVRDIEARLNRCAALAPN